MTCIVEEVKRFNLIYEISLCDSLLQTSQNAIKMCFETVTYTQSNQLFQLCSPSAWQTFFLEIPEKVTFNSEHLKNVVSFLVISDGTL